MSLQYMGVPGWCRHGGYEDRCELCKRDREIRQQKDEIERLKKACELYRQASIQSHSGHWDPTGKWGAGCPECNRASQLRSEAEAFLKEEDTHEMA